MGKVQPLRTTVDTLGSHQVQLPPDKIPQLFKDAIRITRHFKQRFLWIDSLCIVQDCAEDWQNESTNMGYIYKNSFLTIAAETTGDSTESILDPSLTERHVFCPTVSVPYHSPRQNIVGQLLRRKNVRIADMIRGPLSRRAWTLQEDVLSPRVLRWTKQQIRWQCRIVDCTEELPSGVPNNNRDLNHGRFICLPPKLLAQRRSEASAMSLGAGFMDVPALWYYIVDDFASRSLTYDTDKFAAISGLAREVQKHTSNDYRAGLWVQDIHRGLLWYTSPAGSRPNVYVAPSWSWASVNTQPNTHRNVWSLFHPLLKPYKGAGRLVKIADVLEVDVNNTVPDVFSQVTSGHLTIKGPCFRAESPNTEIFIRARQPIVTGDKIFEHQDVKQGTMLYRLDISSDLTTEEMLIGSVVIQIARMEGQTAQKFPGMIYGLLCKAVIETDGRFQSVSHVFQKTLLHQIRDGGLK